MATRTSKGTNSTKVDGTTLVISSVSCTAGDALIVIIGNQTTNIPSTVKWGARELVRTRQRTNTTSGLVASIWIARNIVNTDTRDLTATWGVSIGARAMAASTLDSGHIEDVSVSSVQTASTAPSVGPTDTPSVTNGFALGVLVFEGPDTDTAPTLDAGWTSGQRVGTAGTPPVSNITILEGYQQLTTATATTLSGTGATERDWSNILVVYRPIIQTVPIDRNGSEIIVGDTVTWDGTSTSTVSSFASSAGNPFVKMTLANGFVFNAHAIEVVGA